jgi:hypothetical protein
MPTPEELAADAAEDTPEATAGLLVLIEKMIDLKAQLDAIEEHQREVRAEYNVLRTRYLPQALGDRGLTSVKTPLGTLTIRSKIHASVRATHREDARLWLIANGYTHLLTLEPAAALTLANAFIADGDPVPSFITLFTEETAVLTRKKE